MSYKPFLPTIVLFSTIGLMIYFIAHMQPGVLLVDKLIGTEEIKKCTDAGGEFSAWESSFKEGLEIQCHYPERTIKL